MPKYKIRRITPPIIGKHSFIYRGRHLKEMQEEYGRPNAIAKVFYGNPLGDKPLWKAKWGDDPEQGQPRINTNLLQATQIQNIAHWHGLAPRVYALFAVELPEEGRVACQLVEDAGEQHATSHEEAYVVYEKVKGLGVKYHFSVDKDDVQAHDSMDGKLVDFQTFAFDIPYAKTVEDIYTEKGRYGKKYYQDQKVLGLTGGPRKGDARVKWLGLDKIDFKGKSVLDLGCAGGFFCNYAAKRGAKRVIGVDYPGQGSPDPLMAARHLSNFLANFNVDYEESDISSWDTPKWISYNFDIVLFLSMNFHIGIPKGLYLIDKPYTGVVIFEDNSKNHNAKKTLKEMFGRVELVGMAEDQGNCQKPCYHCYAS